MNNQEFLEEVLNSDKCPKHFAHIYKEFEHYQSLAIETLREFHRICEKNSIMYQLAYGSLLGAVRDGGQIPWDYDVDVIIPYEEKDKLIETLKRELSDEYYFYCPEVKEECRHLFIRIAPVGYRTELLHMDIFYVVGTPEGEKERREYIEKTSELFEIRFGKYVHAFEEARGSLKRLLRVLIKKGKALLKYNRAEFDKYQQLWLMYPAREAKVCCLLHSCAKDEPYYDNFIWDSQLVTIDTGTFRISKKYEYVLQNIYGDYKKIPELQSRIKEVLVHYKWLSKYGRCK